MMTKRCLALALCLVMALALLVPVQAAVPMGDEQAEAPVTPAAPAGAPAPSHSHAVADAPSTLMEVHEHNFTTDGTNSSFFSISGNLSTSKGTVSYEGLTLTQCLKMETATSIAFTADEAGTLTMVFVEAAGTAKVDGQKKTAENGILKVDLETGPHTIAKADGANLYYISFGTNCEHEVTSWKTDKAASCFEDGLRSGTCTKCGNTVTEVVKATGQHVWSTTDFKIVTEPTCTEAGKKVAKCTTEGCTATNDSNPETVPATGHKYEPGYTICVNCGVDSVTGEKHTEHEGVWTDVPDKKATCTTKGEQTRTCTKCGKVETRATDIIAHNFTGEGGKCIMCGKTQAELDSAKKFLAAAGDLESAYALWAPAAGVSSYTASVIDCSTQTETKLDDKFIREYPGYMRVDALGLKEGTYQIKVTANTGDTMTTDVLEVLPHERTGFAFVDGTASGAYNADGTLQSNAVVVYVDNKNFDSVQATIGGKSFTGVQAIVSESGASKEAPGVPVCIRVLGTIDTTGFPKGSWGSSSEGLQIKGDKKNTDKHLTIEGVGNDAAFNGFGMLIRSCKNVEIRNLGLLNFADDGISIDTDNSYLWVHNCDLYYGNPGSASDQVKGDGSLDAKASFHCTFSYNHFWDSGKCSLLGMHNDQDYITYHHNWFDHSDSRHPRIRIAKRVHVYNNFYDHVAKYGVGAAENSGAFVEGNYFYNTKYPMLTAMQGSDISTNPEKGTFNGEPGGMIKAYNNYIEGAKAVIYYDAANAPVDFDAYLAKTRDEKVPPSVAAKKGGTTYTNFDTTDDIGVTAKQVQDPTEAMKTVTQWAGRVQGGDLQFTFDNSTQIWTAGDDTAAAVIPELKSKLTSYKSQLISIGGTVTQSASGGDTPSHTTHTPGDWEETKKAGCDPATQQVVDGQRVKKCIFGGEVLITETLPGYHTDNGTGTCSVCGATISSTGGGSTGGKTLQYSDFPGTDNTSIQDHIADVAGGYFSLVSPDKVLRRATSSKSDEITCIQMDKEGKGGIQFTVSADAAPAKLSVNCSATSDSHPEQTSALVVKKDGAAIADDLDRASVPLSGGAKAAVTVTYSDLAAGTYVISAAAGSAYTLRIYKVTVTEAASSGSTTPSDNNFLDGAASDLHYTVSASTGTVTMTDAIPADDLVFATYWKGDHFLGAKTLTQNQAATALSGWDSIKLIWLNKQDVPQCQAKTVATH